MENGVSYGLVATRFSFNVRVIFPPDARLQYTTKCIQQRFSTCQKMTIFRKNQKGDRYGDRCG